jgi:hypothetical protein
VDAQLRAQDWPVRLAQAIEDARTRPFAWGTHDCATWAFSVAASLRGEAPPKWIGTYDDEEGAMRRLAKARCKLSRLGLRMLGKPLASPLLAWRGDVVWSGGAYGVCIGTHIAQVGPEGLTLRLLADAETAWRV